MLPKRKQNALATPSVQGNDCKSNNFKTPVW